MSVRRSKFRILSDILRIVSREGEANVSKLLLEANLSYSRLSKYLEELVDRGLLQRVEDGREVKFRITPKGESLLREIERVEMIAEAFGIQL